MSPDWTPDGKYIVASKGETLLGVVKLWLGHVDGGSGVQLHEQPENLKTVGAAVSPDGRYIWYARRSGSVPYNAAFPEYQVAVYDRETGQDYTRTSRYGSAIRPTLSPDGRWLVYGSRIEDETGLRIRDLEEPWPVRDGCGQERRARDDYRYPPDQGPTCSDSPLLTLPRACRSLRVQFSQSNWVTCQPGMFRGGVAAPAPETSLSSIPREKRRSTSGADQPLQELERLFREQYNGLCAFVRRYVGDSAVAEDVVQDVFVTLCGRSKAVELGAGMRTYLYRSARNAALNHLNHRRIVERKRRQVHLALSPSHASTDESARQNELAEAIEAAVAELPERARLVFTLSREGGLTYPEIARTLDISKKAVEANLSRALAVLRKKLNIFLS